MLKDGDILICRTNGSLDLVGKAAVVANLSEPAAFASYLIRLRTDARALLPRFLHLFLLSPSGRDQITAEARTTAGQFNLNLEILRDLRFVLPPLDAQARIIRRADILFSLAETIEHRIAAASVRADALTQPILARAFRGELVPTEAELARAEGRNYESGEALLARIQVERAPSALLAKRSLRASRPGARP
jgi:type I restriction enzyme S subunit